MVKENNTAIAALAGESSGLRDLIERFKLDIWSSASVRRAALACQHSDLSTLRSEVRAICACVGNRSQKYGSPRRVAGNDQLVQPTARTGGRYFSCRPRGT
jgi:hypothetical protein